VEGESCGRECGGNSVPDVYGEQCQDHSARLRPVLLMSGLKEVLETQLISVRGALDTRELGRAIRDIEQIPTIAGLAEKDYEVLTEALEKLYNLQNSDVVLDTHLDFFAERVKTRVGRIEDALHEIRDGNNKANTVLRNIRHLYNDFVYKIKELNDDIKKKRDNAIEALAKLAVFDAMLTGAKQEKRTLDKSALIIDFFSSIQTNYLQVDNEYKKKWNKKGYQEGIGWSAEIDFNWILSLPALWS